MTEHRFVPTPEDMKALHELCARVSQIQRVLVERHPALSQPDRAAHQQQVGAGVVRLEVADTLPPELDGVGLFRPGAVTVGIGRVSTGMGCPHIETDPDFLGLMFAFQTPSAQRVDFLAINHPAAPAPGPKEFLDVLAASAASAGLHVPFGDVGKLDLGDLIVSQLKTLAGLLKRLGLWRGLATYAHLARQTARTVRSSTSVQRYWTGVVETGGRLGKFVFTPPEKTGGRRALRPRERYLSEDWNDRIAQGPVIFDLWWIPYLSEAATPLERLDKGWEEGHAIPVGRVVFAQADPASKESRLVALLASEMGANPGNWVRDADERGDDQIPKTRFGAARQITYRIGQEERGVLPESWYQGFFDGGGEIDESLEVELERRSEAKRRAGHAGPGGVDAAGPRYQ